MKAFKQLFSFFASLAIILLFSETISAQEPDSLAQDRISDFRDNVIQYTGQDLLDASFPNSWPIFGSNLRLAIGGYVKLDYVQDFNGMYDRYQVTAQNVPVPGDGRPEQSGYMNMFARESRFNIDFRGKTDLGDPFQIFFEFDFWNLDRAPFNQTVRVRHAYGVYDRLLIGRTWGTATDLYAVPVTIDFEAGDALAGTRRTQIRWEDVLGKKMKYAIGIEMLEYPGINPLGQSGQASQLLPLLAGRITRPTDRGGRLMVAASVFQLRWDPDSSSTDQTALGWGISFSGREYFTSKRHYVFWQASYGDGWGSNILTFISDGSAVLNPNGELETMTALSYGGGFAYNLSHVLTTSVSTFWSSISASQFLGANSMASGGTFHANLIWSPVKKINTGIEYIYGRRTNVDGKFGEANRIQLMIKYIIN